MFSFLRQVTFHAPIETHSSSRATGDAIHHSGTSRRQAAECVQQFDGTATGPAERSLGQSRAREAVTVKIGSQSHQAKADDQGNWKVMLEPMQVGEPLELVVTGKNELRISDVLVGEVWICSGQSNMQWSDECVERFRSRTSGSELS